MSDFIAVEPNELTVTGFDVCILLFPDGGLADSSSMILSNSSISPYNINQHLIYPSVCLSVCAHLVVGIN